MRYADVTGVQTCALPICLPGAAVRRRGVSGPAPAARPRYLRGGAVREGPGGEPGPGRGVRGAGRRQEDRKSVGEGKRVDLGGRRIIQKKKKTKMKSDAYA